MSLSAAVQWWEEWQLRILVLSSLAVQWILFLSALKRRRAIPGWFRSLIWLAYLGSDALAIYSLAALFNRRRKQEDEDLAHAASRALEATWAPILLMHLGGQDGITAYNIEDNELWRRHGLTAVSQITVAIYVFCKSWPGGDNNLLKAAILLFIPGVLKCIEKPLALKNASINSLVSSSEPAQRTANRQGEINLLEQYVREAKDIVQSSAQVESEDDGRLRQQEEAGTTCGDPYDLFVDLASPYPKRLSILKSFCVLEECGAYRSLQVGLSNVFGLLYTKKKTFNTKKTDSDRDVDGLSVLQFLGSLMVRYSCSFLSFASIGLLEHSHREGYNDRDVKITYILLCCTAALEFLSIILNGDNKASMDPRKLSSPWPGMVPQYSLVGFFVRNKKHAKKMSIVSFFGCKEYLDQHWCMKRSSSSGIITVMVLRYLKAGWRDYVQDAASYRIFNDHRGQWTLERNECGSLVWSLNCPFDESVLLWHIATDLCFYWGGHRHDFSQCRQMSNYMMYLLFVNPEMLLPGSRRNLFTTAYDELKGILEDSKPAPMEGSAETHQGSNGGEPSVEEKEVTRRIIAKLQSTEGSQKEGFIHDAWSLAQGLLALGDEEKMWGVIQGVWVEMLCFSAGRCRGYLHAKALGTGGELLTYIWLALSYMGMETLAEKLQRTELRSSGGNTAAAVTGEDIV